MRVLKVAEVAGVGLLGKRRICALITLDVKKAFNSVALKNIVEELITRDFPPYLLKLVSSYLCNRKNIIEAEGESVERQIYSGVPQGSIMGLTLWNTLYDGILKVKLSERVKAVGFAVDLALIVTGFSENCVINMANKAIALIDNWLEKKQLKLAPEKMEAVLLTGRMKVGPLGPKSRSRKDGSGFIDRKNESRTTRTNPSSHI